MNIDLITKLAKLANNNPNEHEANLAARKVCRLLEEGKFLFNGTRTAVDKIPNAGNYGTWNDVKRSTEPQWRSTPPESGSYNNYQDYFWDIVNNMRNDPYRYGSWEPFPKEEPPKQESPKYYAWQDPKWNYVKPSEQKEKRLLKCKKCGNSKLTKFVGLAELFECNTCQWTAYERSK